MIGIIVLNYINWYDTKKCIESIFKNEKKHEYHIYVVDNDSPTKCPIDVEMLWNDKRITLLKANMNKGYSAGNNIGINKAMKDGCQEILVTNSDVYFKKNSISIMSDFLSKNSHVGIVGPKIFLTDGSIQEINMGIKTGLKEKYMYLLRKTIFLNSVKHFITKYCALDKDLKTPFEVHAVSGCCFMMSNECAKKITPFDENTFLYEEELIIGLMCERQGYKTVYLVDSEIIHSNGQNTKGMKAFSYKCFVESEMYYCRHYLKAPILKVIPLYIVRSLKYLIYLFKDRDYRVNCKNYFVKTVLMIRHPL